MSNGSVKEEAGGLPEMEATMGWMRLSEAQHLSATGSGRRLSYPI